MTREECGNLPAGGWSFGEGRFWGASTCGGRCFNRMLERDEDEAVRSGTSSIDSNCNSICPKVIARPRRSRAAWKRWPSLRVPLVLQRSTTQIWRPSQYAMQWQEETVAVCRRRSLGRPRPMRDNGARRRWRATGLFWWRTAKTGASVPGRSGASSGSTAATIGLQSANPTSICQSPHVTGVSSSSHPAVQKGRRFPSRAVGNAKTPVDVACR